MDAKVWFEEAIAPAETTARAAAESVKGLDPAAWLAADDAAATEGLGPLMAAMAGLDKGRRDEAAERYAREQLRGIIRVFEPGVARLASDALGRGDAPPGGGHPPAGADALPFARGATYLVKLVVEFDLPEALKEAQYRYKKVYCRASLSADGDACAPKVLQVYPARLFGGQPRLMKVELKPALAWQEVEGSLGSITTDVQVGVVAPATVGFLGDRQRAPYWEVTEQSEALLGPYDFWFVIDVPPGCDLNGVYLSVLAEGDLKFHLGPFPMGPARRQRQGTTRPRALGEMGGGRREE